MWHAGRVDRLRDVGVRSHQSHRHAGVWLPVNSNTMRRAGSGRGWWCVGIKWAVCILSCNASGAGREEACWRCMKSVCAGAAGSHAGTCIRVCLLSVADLENGGCVRALAIGQVEREGSARPLPFAAVGGGEKVRHVYHFQPHDPYPKQKLYHN